MSNTYNSSTDYIQVTLKEYASYTTLSPNMAKLSFHDIEESLKTLNDLNAPLAIEEGLWNS